MADIGFIGLGNMGLPMASNLLRAGHRLKVFDLNANAMALLAVDGACPVSGTAEAAVDVDFVITMLPNCDVVKSVYLGTQGILGKGNRRPVYLDCSTIRPESAREVATEALKGGLEFLDAPVSGGIMGARDATLCFIVGGEQRTLQKAEAILRTMGKSIIHAGPHGNGQLAKVCNNLLAGILMVGTAETLALGARNGLSPGILSEVMSNSSGKNFMVDRWNPWPGVQPNVPSSHGYKGGFQLQLMLKDLGLAMECAQDSNASVPLGSLARNLFAIHSNSNELNNVLDISSIQRMFFSDLNYYNGES
ncbi:3-hydroxyisobutyrate dehydrogenase [Burkholderia multivorans]|uniref:3-hydroxyisobutyrate dehydrogenase n=1 Tax=Burkholderia multivorans TaxID=87883 RepID=UPI0021C0241C|nr:3-hydroxyisobutyrate dehydrogenase [Burkholderia multivorans]